MDDSLPNPCLPVPCQQVSWKPEKIPIRNIKGSDPINIMQVFIHESKMVANANKDEFVFPPSMYPPRWDERSRLELQIIESSMRNADTSLVRVQTTKTKTEMISNLICRRGICHHIGKENNDTAPHSMCLYKEGIKIDSVVNKSTTSRGPQGKAEPQCTKTNRPNSQSLCSFQVQLRLKEGKYWYMKYDIAERGEHNHIRISYEEQHHWNKPYSLMQHKGPFCWIELDCRPR